jgi:hypothetical protein
MAVSMYVDARHEKYNINGDKVIYMVVGLYN